MSDLIKKTFLAGLGVLSLSREKAEKLAKDLVKRGELAKTEEVKLVKDLMRRAEKSRAEIEKRIEKIVKEILVKLDIPTRKELEALKAKIDKLSKK
ncbi:MAG: polyhydroxyalkanoate synthesis regulator [Candidatus Latescibacterota bacterium]|nr:MAG: polyhydroxyalkanoate synthesis regulator [Candidatus Latescibacterota bacterium]